MTMLGIIGKPEYETLYNFTRKKNKMLKGAIDLGDCQRIRLLFTSKKVKDSSWEEGTWNYSSQPSEQEVLEYVYENQTEDVLLTLLECGIDPMSRSYDRPSLLERLVRDRDFDTMKMVLPYTEDIHGEQIFDMEGYQINTTLLGLCACLGEVEGAKILLDHGFLMKPWSVEEALRRNEDCRGVYNGGYAFDKHNAKGYRDVWDQQMVEPWQFSVLCEDPYRASFFFEYGEDGDSVGFSEMLLHVKSEEMLRLVKRRFPKQMGLALVGENRKKALETANEVFLSRISLDDVDLSVLGRKCAEEDVILRCYYILKERLLRQLTLEEKRTLVKLMLQRRSETMLRLCEEEWATETESCDITEWADWIPTARPADKPFVKLLQSSSLSLVIHPEHEIFCERYHYFDYLTSRIQRVRCLDNLGNLTVLNKVVQVIPPEKKTEEELPFFTKRVLDLGKMTAFNKLKKWGLIHHGNMAAVSAYIVERNLEPFYDQAIQAGGEKSNQKNYEL